MKSVAIVILNFNGRELLKKFLPSILAHSQDASIIVADNCSSDESQQLINQQFPQVTLIEIPANLGFCKGYNFALRQIEAKYYILLNSDVEVTPNWLSPLVNLLETDKTVAAVQPKILSFKEKSKFEYAGAAGGFIDQYGYPFCRGRIFETVELDKDQFDDDIQVFWATGACMAIKAEVYQQLGGFDEDFFAHMEEIDLCWRLKRQGYGIMCTGKSVVYHIGGATLATGNPRKTYYNFRNGLMLLIKNYPNKDLFLRFPIRLGMDWIAVVKFMLSGQMTDAWAVLKAHWHISLRIRKILRKRSAIYKAIPSYKVSMVYRKSIVIDYFLRKKKYFNDLVF